MCVCICENNICTHVYFSPLLNLTCQPHGKNAKAIPLRTTSATNIEGGSGGQTLGDAGEHFPDGGVLGPLNPHSVYLSHSAPNNSTWHGIVSKSHSAVCVGLSGLAGVFQLCF